MKSYLGETLPITAAAAVITTELPALPAAGHLAGAAYPTCDVAGGGVLATTLLNSAYFAQLTDELHRVCMLGSVATPAGIAMDGSRTDMLEEVIGPVRALHSGSGAITGGTVGTVHKRALLASTQAGTGTFSVSGDQSYVAGSGTSTGAITVSGDRSRVDNGEIVGVAGAITASGDRAVVDGSTANTVAITAAGNNSRVESSAADTNAITTGAGANQTVSASTSAAAVVAITGSQAAAIACDGATVSGDNAASIASEDCTVTGDNGATLACNTVAVNGISAAAVATNVGLGGVTIDGNVCATVAVSAAGATTFNNDGAGCAAIGYGQTAGNDAMTGLTNCVLLGSQDTPVAGIPATVAQVYGGYGGARTWRIDSQTGTFYGGTAGGAVPFNQSAVPNAAVVGGGADFAELFMCSGTIAGRLLVTYENGLVRVTQPGDRIRGVVSTTAIVLGNAPDDGRMHTREEWTPVALIGQALVEVGGKCEPGDFLRAGKDGRGMPSPNPGVCDRRIEVDKVIQPYDAAKGFGLCQCLVG